MKLFILGNGFDLHMQLKTAYKNFFEDEEIKKECKKIDEEFKQIPAGNNISGFSSKFNSNIVLAFLNYKKNQDIEDWNQVEKQLELFLKFISDCYRNEEDSLYIKNRNDKNGVEFLEVGNEESYHEFNKYFYIRLNSEGIEMVYSSILEFIFSELKKFEQLFSKYVIQEQNKLNVNHEKYNEFRKELINFFYEPYGEKGAFFHDINFKNFKKKPKSNIFDYVYVLSFNYTTYIKKESEKSTCIKSEFYHKMINIHGFIGETVENSVSIFGIDYNSEIIDDEDIINRFSKTARVMHNGSYSKSGSVLPKLKEKAKEKIEIAIFGHSLSQADYSYFQSLFDYYNIYSDQNVYITVLYTELNEDERTRKTKDIIKLLSAYGKTMNNENHGRNLTHKLLLENRLTIREYIPTKPFMPKKK